MTAGLKEYIQPRVTGGVKSFYHFSPDQRPPAPPASALWGLDEILDFGIIGIPACHGDSSRRSTAGAETEASERSKARRHITVSA